MRLLLSKSHGHFHLVYLLLWHLFLFVTGFGADGDVSFEGPEEESCVESETKPVGECGVATPPFPLQYSSASFVDDSSYLSQKPQKGDIVTFTLHRFEPTTKSGMRKISADLDLPFDTFGTLQLELYGGNYLPDFHDVLSEMIPGETLLGVIIDPRRGEWDHRMEYKLPAAKMGTSLDSSNVSVGTTMRLKGGAKCTITDMTGDIWICDGNDPLAGVVFEVDVTLEGVEEGPSLGWEFSEGNGTANGEKYQVATFALGCFWGGGKLL